MILSLSLELCFRCFLFLNGSLSTAKRLANASALIHVSVSKLLSALDILAARFAVLAVPVAAIACKAQTLFLFRISNRAHEAAFLSRPCRGDYLLCILICHEV